MPLTLAPLTRRKFLSGMLASSAAAMLPSSAWAADEAKSGQKQLDPNSWALFSDIHISEDRAGKNRGVCMGDHLQAAIADVLRQPELPSRILINGDLALNSGKSGDYGVLLDLLKPAREAGIAVTLGLGNHDHRERFYAAFADAKASEPPVEDHHVSALDTPHASLLLLDTLEATNKTPGLLGKAQIEWLDAELKKRADKPAVVMAHHNLDHGKSTKVAGIQDTTDFLACLAKHKHVRGYIFGHLHRWEPGKDSGLDVLNLPAVAYVFDNKQPSGWTLARFSPHGLTMTLKSLDPMHPKHGEKVEWVWPMG